MNAVAAASPNLEESLRAHVTRTATTRLCPHQDVRRESARPALPKVGMPTRQSPHRAEGAGHQHGEAVTRIWDLERHQSIDRPSATRAAVRRRRAREPFWNLRPRFLARDHELRVPAVHQSEHLISLFEPCDTSTDPNYLAGGITAQNCRFDPHRVRVRELRAPLAWRLLGRSSIDSFEE
jgi:hypothetical protein